MFKVNLEKTELFRPMISLSLYYVRDRQSGSQVFPDGSDSTSPLRSQAFLFVSGKQQQRIKLRIFCTQGPCRPCSSLLPRPLRAQNVIGTQSGLEAVVAVLAVLTALNCRVEFLRKRARSLYLAEALPRKHRASSMLLSVLERQAAVPKKVVEGK